MTEGSGDSVGPDLVFALTGDIAVFPLCQQLHWLSTCLPALLID